MSTIASMGVRKAAIVLIQLGKDAAASVLSHLSDSEVEAISAEIARLDYDDAEESNAVLEEFKEMAKARANWAQGGLGFAKNMLEQSLGPEKAAEIMERLKYAAVKMPFQFLHRADPVQLRTFIADEHPQVIALVLAHMTPDRASVVIAGLPANMQAEIAHRIAVMDRTSPEIIRT